MVDVYEHEAWKKHRIPRMTGIYEEMGHCFIDNAGTPFATGGLGAFVSGIVNEKLVPTPEFRERRANWRKGQNYTTLMQYVENGYVMPARYRPGQTDRLYKAVLKLCEVEYGENLWRDFFAEARKRRTQLLLGDRDEMHRIIVDCFDRLPGLEFRKILRKYRFSDKTSLATICKQKDWEQDRRFIPKNERQPGDYADE